MKNVNMISLCSRVAQVVSECRKKVHNTSSNVSAENLAVGLCGIKVSLSIITYYDPGDSICQLVDVVEMCHIIQNQAQILLTESGVRSSNVGYISFALCTCLGCE